MLAFFAAVWAQVLDFYNVWYTNARKLAVDFFIPLWDLAEFQYLRILDLAAYWYGIIRVYVLDWFYKAVITYENWWPKLWNILENYWNNLIDLARDQYAKLRTLAVDWYAAILPLVTTWWVKIWDIMEFQYDRIISLVVSYYKVLISLARDWYSRLVDLAQNWHGRIVFFFQTTLPDLTAFLTNDLPKLIWISGKQVIDLLTALINNPGETILAFLDEIIWPWLSEWLTFFWFPHDPKPWE